MDRLDYEYHHVQYARLFGDHNLESKRHVAQEAQRAHIWHVHDALRDEQRKSIELAQQLRERQAQYFACYGIGRRMGMLWSALRSILEIVRIERSEPLSSGDVERVSRDLNTIYINIVGAIDNYAWCLRHERGTMAMRKLPANRVGLFARDFLQDASFSSLRALLTPYSSWYTDLRSLRDPAAHRIPLSVPPALLRPDEEARYREVNQKIAEAVARMEFDLADQLRAEQDRIGTFMPRFVHNPGEDLIPFYPTIPQDLAQLMRVSDAVRRFLSQPSAAHPD